MILRRVALVALIIAGNISISQSVDARPPTQEDSFDPIHWADPVMEVVRPALNTGRKAGRIYYTSPCPVQSTYVPLPKTNRRRASKGKTGLAAVQDVFRDDKNVLVTEGSTGLPRITIGHVPDAILKTRITQLPLKPVERYDELEALGAIGNSADVRAAMQVLGVQQSQGPIFAGLQMPGPGLPHLPASITNVTLDEALDLVAKTFGGVVWYGACARPSIFEIHFSPVVGYSP